tara:strand:+ start:1602 stop:1934 length:333 start_codon:yes stop_codon:yes gene_type:complete
MSPKEKASNPRAASSVNPEASEPKNIGDKERTTPPTSADPPALFAKNAPPVKARITERIITAFQPRVQPKSLPSAAPIAVGRGSITDQLAVLKAKGVPEGQLHNASPCHH